MPVRIDAELLAEMGLSGFRVDVEKILIRTFYDLLEVRVGMRIASAMSSSQLGEFELFVNRSDEVGAFGWLQANLPNYREVVNEEYDKLRGEVSRGAGDLRFSLEDMMRND